MNGQSEAAASANWADFLLFLLATTAVVFVFAMWTTSIPVNLGA